MTDLQTPSDLTTLGKTACETIVAFLKKKKLTNTGGGKAFYSPKEWKERGEDYGTESELVVVHDGGDHARAFSWDYEDYTTIEALNVELAKIGLFAEQCTTWYSAIYKNRNTITP